MVKKIMASLIIGSLFLFMGCNRISNTVNDNGAKGKMLKVYILIIR